MPQERKARGRKTKRTFIGLPKETSSRTPHLFNTRCCKLLNLSWSPSNDRVRSWRVLVIQTKNSDAGAEVTTKKKFWLPDDSKSRTTNAGRNRDDESIDFDIGYSIKDKQKSYFEALTKKNNCALAFEYIKDEDGTSP
jgi:alanine dehydrogenase